MSNIELVEFLNKCGYDLAFWYSFIIRKKCFSNYYNGEYYIDENCNRVDDISEHEHFKTAICCFDLFGVINYIKKVEQVELTIDEMQSNTVYLLDVDYVSESHEAVIITDDINCYTVNLYGGEVESFSTCTTIEEYKKLWNNYFTDNSKSNLYPIFGTPLICDDYKLCNGPTIYKCNITVSEIKNWIFENITSPYANRFLESIKI